MIEFTDSQILPVLTNQNRHARASCASAVPSHGISSATFYKWRSKFGGMDASLMAPTQGAPGQEPAPGEDVRSRAARAELLRKAMAEE
jgi:putative transposase